MSLLETKTQRVNKIESFRDLEVWQKSILLVKEIYFLTNKFPREEIYGLTSQMRRAAVSIPSNIAEGNTRKGTAEYLNFLYISISSLAELKTQMVIAKELTYLESSKEKEILEKIDHIARMLRNLIKSLRNRKVAESRFPSPVSL